MKRTVSLIAFSCFFLSVFMCASGFGQEKKFVIRYVHQHPSNYSYYKGVEQFAASVEKKSNGRVKFEVYPASQLYKPSEIVKAVTSGDVEMGHCVQDEWGLVFPLANIFTQPFLVTTQELRTELTKGKLSEAIAKEMTKAGAKPLFWMPFDYVSVFLNNKRPLRTPKDFQGLLIRTTPGTMAMVEALGAKAVRLNVDDVYMAMQRGTVDGTWTGPSTVINRKWHEVSKYATFVEMVTIYNVAFVNVNFWNKLPADLQNIIMGAGDEAEKWVEDVCVKEQNDAIELIKKKSQAIILTPQETDPWELATQMVVQNYEKKGGPEIKAAVEELNRLRVRLKKK